MNEHLDAFVQKMDALVAGSDDPHHLAQETTGHLAALIEHPEFLEERHRQPAEDRYQQHVVHVHPEGKYSVVALVWKPGQETSIHDHRCWCIVGVLQGRETETRYELHEADGSWVLAKVQESQYEPGEVCALVPPDENIHKVANSDQGDGLTISIHIYGADIARLGTSINQVFDHPVIDAPHPDSESISWRTETDLPRS
ncbi:hypothetical protein [Nocardioides sp. LHG3406-4]|uniref:cysteine dioxygenase family protein n=1 Tax=Nocardioides sp. LHG3406-4 TaxID=2804575 RepID=UPI003CEA3D89